MANGPVLQNIMNPPGANMPERLADLRQSRATTQGQNLANAQAQVDMMGRAAQSMLESYYPEGSEQPTNPTQAAQTYFQIRKRLIDLGVPSNVLPEKVPTGSQLKQVSDMALSVKEQLALQQPERLTKSDMVQVSIEGQNVWLPANMATGLPTAEDQPGEVKTFTAFAPSLSEEFPEGFTAVRTPQGVMRWTGEGLVEAPADVTEREVTGTAEEVGLTPRTRGALEEEINRADKAISRLSRIEESFRPEFQETWNRIGFAWDAAKEKAGIDLTPQEQEQLGDFSAFKQEAINNINLYIKEITGAQMSEAEADRLRQGAPDPGEGVLDGDSPTQFQRKLDNSMEIARAVRRRAQFARENGLMNELREQAQTDKPMSGKLDLDNFIEAPSDVNSIIDRALGNE